MFASNNKRLVFGSIMASAVSTVIAFQPISVLTQGPAASRRLSILNVAVDPNVVTKKEYEDICGVSFGEESLELRLQRTSYLYPKHVEVIEDIAPIAAQMVDEVVSLFLCLSLSSSARLGCRELFGILMSSWDRKRLWKTLFLT
jgi:hypothetical protein